MGNSKVRNHSLVFPSIRLKIRKDIHERLGHGDKRFGWFRHEIRGCWESRHPPQRKGESGNSIQRVLRSIQYGRRDVLRVHERHKHSDVRWHPQLRRRIEALPQVANERLG